MRGVSHCPAASPASLCSLALAGLALPAPTAMASSSGLCRNVTAQSHLDLKVWSCHTLRNELLGTASVSLGNLLKSGGKRT